MLMALFLTCLRGSHFIFYLRTESGVLGTRPGWSLVHSEFQEGFEPTISLSQPSEDPGFQTYITESSSKQFASLTVNPVLLPHEAALL